MVQNCEKETVCAADSTQNDRLIQPVIVGLFIFFLTREL